ncbi:hypothetical protein RBU49_01625 [Clostridium sp. MB40-C1]|uniref:hypothetical protein n=1 Tax=Clostridium sp. MB40-C1 TaxID=3070996 RepID=UPI0027E1C8EE|nr:hypothetical protein [Clostridium sp. MB40-C1]WMJ80978.1 hypothetical protein RBU49_01625 [Clostridium sp. MB40-C1]
MPLHTIPLCSFSYVGDTLSSATFKYDAISGISKNETRLLYAEETKVDKTDTKSFYSSTIEINKKDNLILSRDAIDVTKAKTIDVDKSSIDITKHKEKEVNTFDNNIDKFIAKELNCCESVMNKEDILALDYNSINIDIAKNKNLSDDTILEMSTDIPKQIIRNNKLELDNENKTKQLENYNICKEVNINSNIELSRDFIKNMNIGSNKNLEIEKLPTEINNSNTVIVERFRKKNLDIKSDNKFIDTNRVKNIDIKDNNNTIIRVNEKKADILQNIYVQRQIIKRMLNDTSTKLMYKINNFKLDKYKFIELDRFNIKDMMKFHYSRLSYINTLKEVYKNNALSELIKDTVSEVNISNVLQLIKDKIYKINKFNTLELTKDNLKNIFKNGSMALNDSTRIDVFKSSVRPVKNISFIDIYDISVYGFNRTRTEIYKGTLFHELNRELPQIYKEKALPLSKDSVDIMKNIHNIEDLEVIKRWWVLGATNPTDQKILPFGYDYFNKPISVNRRDRKYGNLINQENHPISYMPYLEDNMGMDLYYGLDEIDLSVEIMLDMVNIVGMIVQHSANQFANCSGQEAIEFIMEVLLDWINLDTTIKEMNNKGSREHYLRCYRWIRWEAEKIWFMADKDHSINKVMGIKYAGMLFRSLLEYMKDHHFDIVPLWKNLKYMDIERQFNRQASNKDLIKNLDKLKGRRHYYIETQNLNKDNLGGK